MILLKNRALRASAALLVSLGAHTPTLHAEAIPNGLFCDNAVLQQGKQVPVWGVARDDEKVTVTFSGQRFETIAKEGRWMVSLAPMTASAVPATMTIEGETNRVILTNVLVGEVWVCGGQSNMERQLGPRAGQKPLVDWEREAAAANYPEIRHFGVKKVTSTNPLARVTGSWVVCSPQTVTNFTAVGYFFGRDLHLDLKVPIGLIHSSWGGTPAESWTRHDVLASNPVLTPILGKYSNAVATYPERLAKYQAGEPALRQAYESATSTARAEGKPLPPAPKAPPQPSLDPHSPSLLYNGMINPLLPYAIRGAIWYQGESNCENPGIYPPLITAMINDWRAQWMQGDFPFLFVQVAPYYQMPPEIREAQRISLGTTTNTAMVVTTDCGDARDIHPSHKQPVGDRLSLAARALAYGQGVEYSGPLFRDVTFEGPLAKLNFTHTGMGLTSMDQPLKGFTIAGADKVFVPAQADIVGNSVIVCSPQVPAPVAVRYGWENVPDCNLFNLAGLPASPFRTDRE